MARSRTPEQRRRIARIAIVTIISLVAINLLVIGASQHPDTSTPQLPEGIERLYPAAQEVIRPQDTVGADLRDDLQGVLFINNGQIPDDQIGGDPNLGLVTFRPGCAGARTNVPVDQCQYREFEPGTMNLRIDFWPRTESLEDARAAGSVRSFGWQIKVG
jgi:hypothetical protein